MARQQDMPAESRRSDTIDSTAGPMTVGHVVVLIHHLKRVLDAHDGVVASDPSYECI